MTKAAAARRPQVDEPSHNLLGQRLGRKGRGTRDRILAAAERLLADPRGQPFSLSAVAREASLGMTTLYLYFADLTELVLAVLEPIIASAEDIYVARLRSRWPDDGLADASRGFVFAFHSFWDRHSRILHLRNSYGATLDPRLNEHRIATAIPVLKLLMAQMDAEPDQRGTINGGVATVLLTGIERVVTLLTDADFQDALVGDRETLRTNMLTAQAHLVALAIADARANHGRQDALQP